MESAELEAEYSLFIDSFDEIKSNLNSKTPDIPRALERIQLAWLPQDMGVDFAKILGEAR